MPAELSALAKLAAVSAGDNELGPQSLPLALPAQSKLAKLALPRNQLGNAGFTACCAVATLQTLDLTANGLTAVPAELAHLKLLVELVGERGLGSP